MAYPSSPVAFSVKNAADVIQAAHVNDLQTEVTALETALLTSGLAHNLNPSGDATRSLGSSAARWIIHGSQLSTNTVPLAALASTAGTPSTATFYRGDGEWAAPQVGDTRVMAACLVSLSTSIAVVKDAEVGLNWLTIEDDKFGMHSTTANSSRITFAASSGLYAVGVALTFSTAATATGRGQYVRLVANDTTTIATAHVPHILEFLNTYRTMQTVVGMYRAQSTAEYVTVRVLQNSDTTMTVLSTEVTGGKSFWAHQVST